MIHFSGGIEKSLGHKKDFSQTFSIGHWNLNSLVAPNFTKVGLLKTYLSVERFDIFCISETYLNSSITEDDDSWQIPGYGFVRSNHRFNNKRGSVAIYYKNFLPLKLLDLKFVTLLLFIGHQTADDFDSFLDYLKLNLDAMTDNNPVLMVVIGDFNARSSGWCMNEKVIMKELKLIVYLGSYGLYDLKQVINEPTHLFENSSSCINLKLASQPNLVMDAGVHPSLHPNCHHQIVCAKFDLKIHYPSSHERFGILKKLISIFLERL